MGLLSWFKRQLAPLPPSIEPPPRVGRREAGRERHKETGEPAWESSDRVHVPVKRHLDDAGGLGMGYGMQRTVYEDEDP